MQRPHALVLDLVPRSESCRTKLALSTLRCAHKHLDSRMLPRYVCRTAAYHREPSMNLQIVSTVRAIEPFNEALAFLYVTLDGKPFPSIEHFMGAKIRGVNSA
jgi:hypothetical protein